MFNLQAKKQKTHFYFWGTLYNSRLNILGESGTYNLSLKARARFFFKRNNKKCIKTPPLIASFGMTMAQE